MNKKEVFVKVVNNIFDNININDFCTEEESSVIKDYWNVFVKTKSEKNTSEFTENGKNILSYMQNQYQLNSTNSFSAKAIGEGLFISSRSVSGAMRKLIADGYVDKVPGNPVTYLLTEASLSLDLSNK